MATKKLTVEVDADVTRAKKKLVEMEQTGGESVAPRVENAAERMARAMDKATGATQRHAEAAEQSSGSLKQVLKSFGGMAIGMAAQYAANNMDEGPAKTALGYGSSMAQGAAMGMMFGPYGAAAGAVLGAGKEWINQDAQDKAREKSEQDAANARLDSLESLRESIRRTREWKAETDRLTNADTDLTERQKELQAEIEKREKRERELRGALSGDAGPGGDAKRFAKNMSELGKVAGETDALKALAAQLEKEGRRQKPGSAADYSALDSLARVGGSFAGSEQGFRNLQSVNEKQLETLKSIERKTTKGGTF